jgi:hypothetical protein
MRAVALMWAVAQRPACLFNIPRLQKTATAQRIGPPLSCRGAADHIDGPHSEQLFNHRAVVDGGNGAAGMIGEMQVRIDAENAEDRVVDVAGF